MYRYLPYAHPWRRFRQHYTSSTHRDLRGQRCWRGCWRRSRSIFARGGLVRYAARRRRLGVQWRQSYEAYERQENLLAARCACFRAALFHGADPNPACEALGTCQRLSLSYS